MKSKNADTLSSCDQLLRNVEYFHGVLFCVWHL